MNIDDKGIQDLIAKTQAAEKVVEGMEEGPRRDKAFEMVLQRLLDGQAPSPAPRRRRGGKRVKGRARQPSAPTAAPKSRRAGAREQLDQLVEEGFFNSRRSLPEIAKELQKRGHIYKLPALSPRMLEMTRDNILRRDREQGEDGRKKWFYKRAE